MGNFNFVIKSYVEPELQMFPNDLALKLVGRDVNAQRKTNTLSFNQKAVVDLGLSANTEISFVVNEDTNQMYFFKNTQSIDVPSYKLTSKLTFKDKNVYDYIATKFSLNVEEDNYIKLSSELVKFTDELGEVECYKLESKLGVVKESLDTDSDPFAENQESKEEVKII